MNEARIESRAKTALFRVDGRAPARLHCGQPPTNHPKHERFERDPRRTTKRDLSATHYRSY